MFCQTLPCEARGWKTIGGILSTVSRSLPLLSSFLKNLKRSPCEEAIEKAAVKSFDSLYYSLSAH